MVKFGQSGNNWVQVGKSVVFGQKWLQSGCGQKVVLGQSGCFWAKVFVFWQK